MKLWQKTYLLSTLLCALILYGCMFGVTAPALTATVKGATDAALREEKAIVSALERTMDQAPEGRAIPVLKSFLAEGAAGAAGGGVGPLSRGRA